MAEFQLSDSVVLRSLKPEDADELYDLIDADRPQLARWMPWAGTQTPEGTREFIRTAIKQERDANGFQVALVRAGAIAGVLGFHGIDRENASTTLGYWLASESQGRGLMSAAVNLLIDHAFERWNLHRVEIRAAPDNHRSRALAKRLGFHEEGVLRGAERWGEEYRDLVSYSLLATDPRPR